MILLDALDEVPQDERDDPLLRKLNEFASDYKNCLIIGTSRIVGYGGKLIDGAKDMEIVPFTQQQTEQYIETWFTNAQNFLKDKSVTARGLIQALRDRPQIGGLAQNPLLLSLICSLYQRDELTLPARRWQIYQQSVDYMLDEWSHDNQRLSSDAAQIDTKKELLEELAYQFSCQETDVLSLRQLRKKIKDYLLRNNATDLDDKTHRLIEELSEQDGILQKLNLEEERYVFLHRTFQEYFTASYLNHLIEDDRTEGIALIKQYFWNYDWHETLTLLAGLMKQSMVLIEAILSTRDDIFNTKLLLAGRCISECSQISNPLIEETINRIYQFWLKYSDFEFVKANITAISQSNLQMLINLGEAINDKDKNVRQHAVEILGRVGDARAVSKLIQICDKKELIVRNRALLALRQICCFEGGKAEFLQAFRNENANIRRLAAWVSGQIDLTVAVKPLRDLLLKEKEVETRQQAAEALGLLGSVESVESLIAVLLEESEFNNLKRTVVKALGQIGDSRAVKPLCRVCNTCADRYLRRRVVWALARIGNSEAVSTLAQILREKDPDRDVRHLAVYALEKIGTSEAAQRLVYALTDEDYDVKRHAIKALGEIGDSKGAMGLNQVLSEDLALMREAEWALMQMGVEGFEILKPKFFGTSNLLWTRVASGTIDTSFSVDDFADVNFYDTINKLNLINYGDAPDKNNEDGATANQDILDEKISIYKYELLADIDVEIRIQAAQYLGGFNKPDVVMTLIKALRQDLDSTVRFQVANSLGRICNSEVLKPLLQALFTDRSSNVRYEATNALRSTQKSQTVDRSIIVVSLIQAFLSDKDIAVRKNILDILDKSGYSNLINILISNYSDNFPKKQAERSRKYQSMTSNISDYLNERVEDLKRRIQKFGKEKSNDFEKLKDDIEKLQKKNKDTIKSIKNYRSKSIKDRYRDKIAKEKNKEADKIITKLPEFGGIQSVGLLTRIFLESQDELLKQLIDIILNKLKCPLDSTVNLIFQLNSLNSKTRCHAAEILGQRQELKAIEPLIQALNDDEDYNLRKKAVEALSKILEKIHYIRAIEALKQACKDPNRDVIQIAKNALKKISNPQTVETLLQTLRDDRSSAYEKEEVVRFLGEIGDERSEDALFADLQDRHSEIRRYAAGELKKRDSSTCLKKLLQSEQIDIYDEYIFLLARSLAIRFSKQRLDCIPVYPELVGKAENIDQREK